MPNNFATISSLVAEGNACTTNQSASSSANILYHPPIPATDCAPSTEI
jgi:hypothetical protein